MAEMIPDRMPSGASAGEKKLFDILQKLPDDCIVYYEPVIQERYPDFIVIMPKAGLMVIEVKGWYPRQIQEASQDGVRIDHRGHISMEKHPDRQAREYKFALMETCRSNPCFTELCHPDGSLEGHFLFPFGHFFVLSNITAAQIKDHGLMNVFTPERGITRDVLDEWDRLAEAELLSRIESFFSALRYCVWVMSFCGVWYTH